MADTGVNRVTNANLYVDGVSQLGRVEEATLPDIVNKMVDHKALGLVGSLSLPSGIDKMTAKFKFNAFYSEVFRNITNPYKACSLQLRASIENHDSEGLAAEIPLVAHMRGFFNKIPGGAFKQHDNVELETEFNVTYFKLVIDGQDIHEIDVLANIFIVDGVDLLANYRENLGI